MLQTPVRAVIFDWGGTLTPWHTVDHVARLHGLSGLCGVIGVEDRHLGRFTRANTP
ncbi:MAG TPA: hypothetical protein VH307_19125 [Streptosporangiaceae bacterium]|nr:hypothetical protein [Streptosporangiaceae bacterium]